MIRLFKIIALLAMLPLFSSCFVKGSTLKNPCQSEVFLKDIASYSKAELVKLASVLEANSYANKTFDGCRAALLGQVYLAQDRMSEASDYFSFAAKKLPELSDYFLLAKANAEIKKHNFDQANRIANALIGSQASVLSPQFALRVRQVLADIAVQKKDDQQIINTHRELLAKGYTENEALLFNLAAALTNVGEHQKANEVYKRLLIYFPISPGAKRAQQLRNLAQYNLDLKETEKRFDKLIEKLAFDQVVKDADLLLAKSGASMDDNTRGQIKSLAVKSLMLNNRFQAGISRGHQMATRKNATAREIESYAWGLAKVDRFIDAADFYGRFAAIAKDKDDQAKGCFFRGFSLYEASLYSMAQFAWQSCPTTIKDTAYYENHLWYQALTAMLNGNNNKALTLLGDLKKLFGKSADSEKYAYFLGQTLNQLNKKSAGDALLLELAKKAQPSYYVLLARQSLKLANPRGVDIAPDALSKLARRAKNTDCKNALVLFHLGFPNEARDLILRSKAVPNDKLAMLQHIGFYHDVWKRSYLLNPMAAVESDSLNASPSIRSSFPLPHHSTVDQMSKKYAVNKSLLYAIIRAESGFLEHAESYRGALGLMQMMPFVAHDLASKLNINEFTSDLLKNPKIAIELGALLVATLQRQFENPHLVVAAYNAGPHQVQKWLDRFGYLPTELFVERIPYKQTRDYIKKVLPSESLYHALDGQPLRLVF